MAGHELQVEEEDAGERLDVVLVRRVEGLSRSRAKTLIGDGQVRVDGRRQRRSHRVSSGERIEIDELPPPTDFYCEPDPEARLMKLLENERFVIVDKPAGMPSHPLRPGERGTLAGALVARYPEMRDVGYSKREPGIVHRLDTGTSGVMLAARTRASFEALRELLRKGRIQKRYLARCVGEVEAPSVIDTPIANDPRDSRKVRACIDPREIKRLGALPARTEVLSSADAPMGSLVEVRTDRARRHQIRAHLASIGHPLLGDSLYGGPALDRLDHHLLHASAIQLEDTWTHSPWAYATRCKTKRTPGGWK